MAESTAHLVDQVIPRVPVRLWVLSFPIPLRILFAAPPRTAHAGAAHRPPRHRGYLLKQAGLKRATADTGAVTLVQRFGSAAHLNTHLHCLVLDGVSRRTEGEVLRVWWQAQDYRRHRRTGGDSQDTHAPGFACARATALTGAATGSLSGGLILKAKAVLQRADDTARPALA
jgi:hypothetical protein